MDFVIFTRSEMDFIGETEQWHIM